MTVWKDEDAGIEARGVAPADSQLPAVSDAACRKGACR